VLDFERFDVLVLVCFLFFKVLTESRRMSSENKSQVEKRILMRLDESTLNMYSRTEVVFPSKSADAPRLDMSSFGSSTTEWGLLPGF